ncbi:MAG: dephospho-CoA kinase [Lachnospiraceae bacterium]
MKIIGITGGIGAGKSTVLDILRQDYHAYVIEADKVGHLVMQPDGSAYLPVINTFGNSILDSDGQIDRKKLGRLVFAPGAKQQLEALNAIIHPAVKQYIMEDIRKVETGGQYEYYIVEAALLIEDHYDLICHESWYIYATEDVRLERLSKQRNMTNQAARAVMQQQLSDEIFRQKCRYVIDNSGSLSETREQISVILSDFYG